MLLSQEVNLVDWKEVAPTIIGADSLSGKYTGTVVNGRAGGQPDLERFRACWNRPVQALRLQALDCQPEAPCVVNYEICIWHEGIRRLVAMCLFRRPYLLVKGRYNGAHSAQFLLRKLGENMHMMFTHVHAACKAASCPRNITDKKFIPAKHSSGWLRSPQTALQSRLLGSPPYIFEWHPAPVVVSLNRACKSMLS